jgi:hypothetical protein
MAARPRRAGPPGDQAARPSERARRSNAATFAGGVRDAALRDAPSARCCSRRMRANVFAMSVLTLDVYLNAGSKIDFMLLLGCGIRPLDDAFLLSVNLVESPRPV